jgi:hypothetical protein
MLSAPVYRKNVTDTQQAVIEEELDQHGIAVFMNAETRDVVREGGGAEHVAHGTAAAVNIGKNGGVSMPWDDKPGKFEEQTIGRRV